MAATAETLVEDGREGQPFFPIQDAVREMGAGVGLLARLRSRGLVRVREAVWTSIGGGRGQALGVVWGSASISESESPSSPQGTRGMFESASHCAIWAGQTSVGDYVTGFELWGSEGPPAVGWLYDIHLARLVCMLVFLLKYYLANSRRYLNLERKKTVRTRSST